MMKMMIVIVMMMLILLMLVVVVVMMVDEKQAQWLTLQLSVTDSIISFKQFAGDK